MSFQPPGLAAGPAKTWVHITVQNVEILLYLKKTKKQKQRTGREGHLQLLCHRRSLCRACRTAQRCADPNPLPVPPQSKLHMEGFRSLKEGEAVEFTFKKSSKGLESIRVTGPGGVFCIGSERRPKGKSLQKRRSKGDR